VRIFAKRALLPNGWASNVTIDVAGATIAQVAAERDARSATEFVGTLVPGMPNLHSHAFQRAMAGHGERRASGRDDFWSWREAMYALALELGPVELHRIALATYRAMLRAGYTAVAEFHYIHRDPRGEWYADKCAASEALVCAAREAGIAICLLPALYSQAAPDGTPLGERQRRFATSAEDVLEIAAALRSRFAGDESVVVGACGHSLRAVTLRGFATLLEGSPRNCPVHVHVAEQEREVAEVEAAFGARPVELLVRSFDVNERWCLVHATQTTEAELASIAGSGAVAGLCPTTEANLGDGLFGLEAYLEAGGALGIGSDSNVSISPPEELRLLEYGQRLLHRRRILGAAGGRACGEALYALSAAGGARACGLRAGAIAPGLRADLVELPSGDDLEGAVVERTSAPQADPLDRYLFADVRAAPARVMAGGAWRA
jgi:formimidoylglutamate deiminase